MPFSFIKSKPQRKSIIDKLNPFHKPYELISRKKGRWNNMLISSGRFHLTNPNPVDKCGWELTFQDEFNTSSLDQDKWTTETFYGARYHPQNITQNSPASAPREYLSPDNFELTGNSIKLIATDEHVNINHTSSPPRPDVDGNYTIRHQVAQIDSYHSWQSRNIDWRQKYGYFEIRCRMPNSKGMWPAFWLYGEGGDEIDIFEFYTGKGDFGFESNYHFYPFGTSTQRHIYRRQEHKTYHADQEFGIYALSWDSNRLRWLYNNRIIREIRNPGFHKPMHIIINTALDKQSDRGQFHLAEFPNSFEIDYVRAYRKI